RAAELTRAAELIRAESARAAELALVAEPLPAIDQRTPGSALVLPANPLQNLSDESIEGFVDCTLYEESGNFFHPAADDGQWNDELADPPAAPLATRSTGSGTVPAMPFDAAPDLTVLARGNTESLRVARDQPADAPPQPMVPQSMPMQSMPMQSMPPQSMPPQSMPMQSMPMQSMPPQSMPPQSMPPQSMPPQVSSDALFAPPSDASFAPSWSDAANPSGPAYATYPTVDPSQYPAQYATPQPVAPQVPLPEPETLRLVPMWPRWLIIGGTALAAIIVAFILAKLVRGSSQAESERTAVSRAVPPSTPDARATGT